MAADGVSHALTIYGSNFQSGNIGQWQWNGTGGAWSNFFNNAPTINSASQVTITMNPGTVAGTMYVRVCRSVSATTAADCSGSQALAVTAVVPVPGVSSISPTTMAADGVSHALTIYGSNFQSGNIGQWQWNGTGGVWSNFNNAPTINSASQVTITMNPGTVAAR